MRKMTQEQLKHYVLAGYFPERTDMPAICDLQDVVGHQHVSYIEKLLHDDDTHDNTLTLLNLVWSPEVVHNYLKRVESLKEHEAELQKAIDTIKKYSYLFKAGASDFYSKTISDYLE